MNTEKYTHATLYATENRASAARPTPAFRAWILAASLLCTSLGLGTSLEGVKKEPEHRSYEKILNDAEGKCKKPAYTRPLQIPAYTRQLRIQLAKSFSENSEYKAGKHGERELKLINNNEDNGQLEFEEFKKFMARFNYLKTLELANATTITTRTLGTQGQLWKHLTILRLKGNEIFGEEQLTLRNLNNLEEFRFTCNESLKRLVIDKCSNLVILNLSSCPELSTIKGLTKKTETGGIEISTPKLTTLELARCPSLNNPTIKKISRLTSLTKLDLSGWVRPASGYLDFPYLAGRLGPQKSKDLDIKVHVPSQALGEELKDFFPNGTFISNRVDSYPHETYYCIFGNPEASKEITLEYEVSDKKQDPEKKPALHLGDNFKLKVVQLTCELQPKEQKLKLINLIARDESVRPTGKIAGGSKLPKNWKKLELEETQVQTESFKITILHTDKTKSIFSINFKEGAEGAILSQDEENRKGMTLKDSDTIEDIDDCSDDEAAYASDNNSEENSDSEEE